MDILSIGNSFSQDAQRYLSRIAKADGVELSTGVSETYIADGEHYEAVIVRY